MIFASAFLFRKFYTSLNREKSHTKLKGERKMKDNTRKTVEGFGYFLGAAAYGFTHAPAIWVRDIKQSRKRKKMKKGLDAWYKIMKEMEESGEYSSEQLTNIARWFAEGCSQYSKMF